MKISNVFLLGALSVSLNQQGLLGKDYSIQPAELLKNDTSQIVDNNNLSGDLSCSMMMHFGGLEDEVSKIADNLFGQGERLGNAGGREIAGVLGHSRSEAIVHSTVRAADQTGAMVTATATTVTSSVAGTGRAAVAYLNSEAGRANRGIESGVIGAGNVGIDHAPIGSAMDALRNVEHTLSPLGREIESKGYEGWSVAQAATHAAIQAKEEIEIAAIAGGGGVVVGGLAAVMVSRTQAAARANLLSAQAADAAKAAQASQGGSGEGRVSSQSLVSASMEEKAEDFLELSVKQAAVWEAQVNEAVGIATKALEAVSEDHRTIMERIKEHQAAVDSKEAAAKEALDQRSTALNNVPSATAGAIVYGAISVVCMNPVPLVMGGFSLVRTVHQGIKSHYEVKKRSLEADVASVDLNYANAKAKTLTETKEKAEALSAALTLIKQAAEISLLETIDIAVASDADVASREDMLATVREEALHDAVVLRKAAAAELVEWAVKNLEKTKTDRGNAVEKLKTKETDLVVAEKKYNSGQLFNSKQELVAVNAAKENIEVAKKSIQECDKVIAEAEEHLLHARSIFDAVESRDTVAAQQESAFQELDSIREKTAVINQELKSAEDAYPALEQAYKALPFYYAQEEKAAMNAAEGKIKELKATIEELAKKVTEAESAAEGATKALDDLDERVVEWDNLRAWNVVVMGEPMIKKFKERLAREQAEREMLNARKEQETSLAPVTGFGGTGSITLDTVAKNIEQTALVTVAKKTFVDAAVAEDEYAAMKRARAEEKARRRAEKAQG